MSNIRIKCPYSIQTGVNNKIVAKWVYISSPLPRAPIIYL